MNPKKRAYLSKDEKDALNMEIAAMDAAGQLDDISDKEVAKIISERRGFNITKSHVLKAKRTKLKGNGAKVSPRKHVLPYAAKEGQVSLGQVEESLKSALGMLDAYRDQERERIKEHDTFLS